MLFRSRFGLLLLLAALLLLPLASQYNVTDLDLSGSAVNQEAPAADANHDDSSSGDSGSNSSSGDSESNNDDSSESNDREESSDNAESSGDSNAESEEQSQQEESTSSNNASNEEATNSSDDTDTSDNTDEENAEDEAGDSTDESSSEEDAEDESSGDDQNTSEETADDDENTDDEDTNDDSSTDDESTGDETTDEETTGDESSADDENPGEAETGDESDNDEDDSGNTSQPEVTEEPGSGDSDTGSETGDDSPESTEEPTAAPPTTEAAPEVTEEPAPVTTPAPEATEETQFIETPAPETTEEPDPEATVEVEPDESADLGITSVVCVPGTGVVFVITNSGGDMTEARDYAIDGSGEGSFQLDAGDHIEIEAGYGNPVLSSDEMEANLGSDCAAPGRIAGFVWNNHDGDDTLAETEPGFADVTVTLMQTDDENSEPISTVTLEDGSYSFELLLDGTYQVTVDTETLPPRLLPSYDLDAEADSQTVITLENGAEVLADFGYTLEPPGAISGLVWDDQNGDGVRDGDEPGMAGVQLILKQGDDEITSLTTDDGGLYAFADIIAGEYTLAVVNAPDDAQATADPDEEPNGITLVGVRSGATTADVNFGYLLKQPGAISGVVWADLNGDGERNEGEPGLGEAIISLDDTEISITSADDGSYMIDNLHEGDYTVLVDISAGLDDYLPPENAAIGVTVVAGETIEDVNFGILPRPVSLISGAVWADLNGDGLIDEAEPGLNGVTINLGDGAGTALASTTTDETGAYRFGDLRDGLYIIGVTGVDGWLLSTGQEAAIQAEAGVDYVANFSYLPEPPASIAGLVWSDQNGDGLFDDDESGLPNVEITLAATDGEPITTTTDETGAYAMRDLRAGTYTLSVTAQPEDYQLTASPEADTITLSPGDALEALNYGYLLPPMSTVSGVVWVDADGDGLRGEEEAGLVGITVNLLDAEDESVTQTMTAADGTYAINGLRLGDYTISLSDVPGGLTATYDPDGDLNGSTALSLTADGVPADFGYQAMSSSSISGLVWLETGNFGTRDSGEGGLAGAVVRLLDSDGNEIGTIMLEASGHFEFSELEPGQYTLQVDASALPAKLFATYDRDGEPDFSTRITLRPGEDLRDVEFGIVGTF